MAAGIIAILAALIPLVVFLVRRRIAKKDDPKVQLQKANDETDKMVATGNADALNTLLDDDLRGVPDENKGNLK